MLLLGEEAGGVDAQELTGARSGMATRTAETVAGDERSCQAEAGPSEQIG